MTDRDFVWVVLCEVADGLARCGVLVEFGLVLKWVPGYTPFDVNLCPVECVPCLAVCYADVRDHRLIFISVTDGGFVAFAGTGRPELMRVSLSESDYLESVVALARRWFGRHAVVVDCGGRNGE